MHDGDENVNDCERKEKEAIGSDLKKNKFIFNITFGADV